MKIKLCISTHTEESLRIGNFFINITIKRKVFFFENEGFIGILGYDAILLDE